MYDLWHYLFVISQAEVLYLQGFLPIDNQQLFKKSHTVFTFGTSGA
jgi:hypothetical protein